MGWLLLLLLLVVLDGRLLLDELEDRLLLLEYELREELDEKLPPLFPRASMSVVGQTRLIPSSTSIRQRYKYIGNLRIDNSR